MTSVFKNIFEFAWKIELHTPEHLKAEVKWSSAKKGFVWGTMGQFRKMAILLSANCQTNDKKSD
jgi:hypothetical protein